MSHVVLALTRRSFAWGYYQSHTPIEPTQRWPTRIRRNAGKGQIMTQPVLPKEWQTSDQLNGYDFVDKAELLNEPFRITSVEFYANAHGIHFANVQAEYRTKIPFAFNDSSTTGVRAQLLDYVAKVAGEVVDGTVYAVSLVAPRGLRLSEFGVTKDGTTVQADDPRSVRKGKSHYLTTSGVPKTAEIVSAVPLTVEEATPSASRAKRK